MNSRKSLAQLYTLFAILFLSPLLLSPNVLAIDYDDLVDQLLNQRQTLPLPLYVDGQKIGELEVTLRGESVESFAGENLLSVLPVNPEVLQQIQKTLPEEFFVDSHTPNAVITADQLSIFNIQARYDSVALRIVLDIPLRLLATRVISRQSISSAQKPEKSIGNYSFFTNIRYGLQDLSNEFSGVDNTQQTQTVDLESVVAYSGWALESAGLWRELKDNLGGADTSWRRSYTRLVTDSLGISARWQFGDLNYNGQNFQRVSPLLGLGVASNQQLALDRIGRVTGGESFFLEDTSRVEIFVNNRLVRTLYLARGNYEVRDLPGVSGINDVRLVISNSQGEQQAFNYSFVFSQALLAQGTHDFSYNIGALRENNPTGNSYSQDWLLSAYHRYGLSPSLTVGANIQAAQNHEMPGLNIQWAGSFGALAGQYVRSFRDDVSASATLVQYRYEKRQLGQLNMVWQFFEPNFSAPNTPVLQQQNARKSQALISISKAMGQRFLFNSSYRESVSRLSSSKGRAWELGIAAKLWKHLRVNAVASRNHVNGLWEDTNLRLDFSWQAWQPAQLFNGQYTSLNKRYRLNYNNRFAAGQHQLATQLIAEKVRERSESRNAAALRYNNHRFESSASHERFSDQINAQVVSRAGLGAAIVMANNRWAISRPIAGSFAVIATESNLNGGEVGVNPTYGGGYASKISRWSPAVISGISPYYAQSLIINAEGTDLEYESRLQNIRMLTNYREGTLISLHADDTKVVQGEIVDPQGEPVTFSAGEAIHQATGVALLFFTNEAGEFLLEGVKPGEYKIVLFGKPKQAWPVVISSTGAKRVKLDPLVLAR